MSMFISSFAIGHQLMILAILFPRKSQVGGLFDDG